MPTQILGTQMATDRPQIATDHDREELNALTWRVIGAGQKVSRALGIGFLEKVYENALRIELERGGLQVSQQQPLEVRYEGEIVGAYVTDLLIESKVLIELKAQQALDRVHHAQCVHYLRATGLPLCLLLNFGRPRLEVRRVINAL
jgi:GxxExxY protein